MRDFVFREEPSGNLRFIGDFEGLYKNVFDPWEQSANKGDMSNYYNRSRKRLLDNIYPKRNSQILEIGSGLGFVTKLISETYPFTSCDGLDISETAIKRASNLFPDINFFVGDICSNSFNIPGKYDIVILSQLLWYIIEKFPIALDNCSKIMKNDAKLIITQAFLKKPQKYAKELMDGFNSLEQYFRVNVPNGLEIFFSDYDANDDFVHYDGILVLKKN